MKAQLFSLVVLSALLYSCNSGKSSSTTANQVSFTLESKSGSSATGQGTFTEKDGKVTFNATIKNLSPGVHAIHLHEKADCSAADGSSAGGHWNPTFKKHGKWGEGEYHKGDIGNFTTDEFGNGTITFVTDEWCIGCGDATRDILGKSVIVHEKPDDFVTQPTGNAGGRVACAGVIR